MARFFLILQAYGVLFIREGLMLKQEFDYYLAHQEELVAKYNGKYLVIKNQSVVGVFDSESEAYFETLNKYEAGSFIIQLCTPGKEAYTATFHSRYAF